MSAPWRAPLARRRLLQGTVATAVLAPSGLLAACGGSGGDAPPTPAGPGSATTGDLAALAAALERERRAEAAHRAAAAAARGEARRTLSRLAEQERRHAAAVTTAIRDLGGTPEPAPAAAEHDLPGFGGAREALEYVLRLEEDSIAAWIDALPKLSRPALRATAASIVTAEAQHVAVLAGALGRPPIREAFVVGRKL